MSKIFVNRFDRNFIFHTLAAIFYNGLAGLLIMYLPAKTYAISAALFLVAGFHLLFLFFFAFQKVRKMQRVGFLGFSILSVLLVHVIFWLLFVNLP